MRQVYPEGLCQRLLVTMVEPPFSEAACLWIVLCWTTARVAVGFHDFLEGLPDVSCRLAAVRSSMQDWMDFWSALARLFSSSHGASKHRFGAAYWYHSAHIISIAPTLSGVGARLQNRSLKEQVSDWEQTQMALLLPICILHKMLYLWHYWTNWLQLWHLSENSIWTLTRKDRQASFIRQRV